MKISNNHRLKIISFKMLKNLNNEQMNDYERRVKIIAKRTTSNMKNEIGQIEPNRYEVIKPKTNKIVKKYRHLMIKEESQLLNRLSQELKAKVLNVSKKINLPARNTFIQVWNNTCNTILLETFTQFRKKILNNIDTIFEREVQRNTEKLEQIYILMELERDKEKKEKEKIVSDYIPIKTKRKHVELRRQFLNRIVDIKPSRNFKILPRVTAAWKTKDLDQIKRLNQKHSGLTNTELARVRARHYLPGLEHFLFNPEIRNIYCFKTERGYGIQADFIMDGTVEEGIIFLGYDQNILFHRYFLKEEQIDESKGVVVEIDRSKHSKIMPSAEDKWESSTPYIFDQISETGVICMEFSNEKHQIHIYPVKPELLDKSSFSV